jgi:predicted NAD/FAD-dependent oxidoreductase
VVFSTPVPADPTVAVIGGGASGLSCASALAARGVRSVVFDTVLIRSSIPTLPPSLAPRLASRLTYPPCSTPFVQGKHGLGGRLATRTVDGGGGGERRLVFDHAAQFFTASDERFRKLVEEWVDRGLVREWRGSVGELEAGGRFTPTPSSTPRYIGVNGMLPLANAMLPEVHQIDILRMRSCSFIHDTVSGPTV